MLDKLHEEIFDDKEGPASLRDKCVHAFKEEQMLDKSHDDLHCDAEFHVDTDTVLVRGLTGNMWRQDGVKSMLGESETLKVANMKSMSREGERLALTGRCIARAAAQHHSKQAMQRRDGREEQGIYEREEGRKGQSGRGQEGRKEERSRST